MWRRRNRLRCFYMVQHNGDAVDFDKKLSKMMPVSLSPIMRKHGLSEKQRVLSYSDKKLSEKDVAEMPLLFWYNGIKARVMEHMDITLSVVNK